MFRNIPFGKYVNEEKGVGLVAAMFAVVILALFGVLIARYIATTTVASAEDFLWAQTLYSAESTANRQILYNDGGGTGGFVIPVIQNVTSTVTDTYVAIGQPATLSVQGTVTGTNISRTVEVKYIL